MKQDKWGYPRKWLWWRDSMFWAITFGWGIFLIYPINIVIIGRGVTPGAVLCIILVAPLLVCIGFHYWYAFDSYRLGTPHRWHFLFAPWNHSRFDIHYYKTYFEIRVEVLEELRKRRDLPY